jgi:hypothetical protein
MQISIHASGFCADAARIGTKTDQAGHAARLHRVGKCAEFAIACVDDDAKDER